MSYSLRPACAEDVEVMMEVAHEGLRPHVAATWGWHDVEQRRRFRAEFEPSCTRIIRSGGRDVGYLRVEDRDDHVFLAGIYLAEDARGKGLGSEVLGDLMRQVARTGRPLRLRVLLSNPARRLYERLGFRATATTEFHVYLEYR